MSCGVSALVCCDAFDGASGAAWIVVTVFWDSPSPPNAATTATTTPPPSRADTKGMAKERFIDERMIGRMKAIKAARSKADRHRRVC